LAFNLSQPDAQRAAQPSRSVVAAPAPAVNRAEMPAAVASAAAPQVAAEPATRDWARILAELNLQGPARQLAAHCVLLAREGRKVQLRLDPQGETFRRPGPEEKLTQALSTYFGESIKLEFLTGTQLSDTPARQHQAAAEDRLQAARAAIDGDPNVQALREVFGATVQPESVRPVQ